MFPQDVTLSCLVLVNYDALGTLSIDDEGDDDDK